jgi:hypothetical protein
MGRALALCLVGAAYLYVFPLQPVINNPNENVRFYMTAALVDHQTFAIDEVERAWGWVNDKARFGGHVYSVKAPGTSYLGVVPYLGYRLFCLASNHVPNRHEALWACRVFASIVPTLFFLAFFARFLERRRISPIGRRAAFFSVALGSAFFAYAILFVSHTLAACSAFAALGILGYLDSYRSAGLEESPWLAGWAGFFAASVTMFEYPGFVASVLLSIYALFALRPKSRLVWYAIGALVPTLLVMLFQWRAFGNPLTPGHRYLDNPAFRALAQQGFFGASGFDPHALGLLGDPAYGLFPLTPFFFAAPIGFVALFSSREDRRPAAVALAIVLCTFAVIACMNNWRGGWTVGPRYLVTLVPFVAWAAAAGWDAIARPLPRVAAGLVVGLAAAGLVASGIPSAIYPHVPEAFTRPLPQLFRVLWRHGYAPYSLGQLVHLPARASLVPLAVFGLLAAIPPLAVVRGWGRRAFVLAIAALFFACTLAPLVKGPRSSRAARERLALVTRSWRPEGRDDVAILRQRIAARPDPALRRRLARLLHAEGRDREAREVSLAAPSR